MSLCRMLLRSPVAAQLERIALPSVRLEHESITMLVEQRARLPALAALQIETYGRGAAIAELRAAGYPVQTSPPKNGNK
jgi:hypothetical protein